MVNVRGLASLLLLASACGGPAGAARGDWEGHSIVGPWTQGNLAVFLIERKGAPRDDLNLLTFEEAIERLVFLAKIDAGIGELDAGKGVSHDEAKRRLGM